MVNLLDPTRSLDDMIILNEKHLQKVLTEYVEYYNTVRPHLSLKRNSPIHRIAAGSSPRQSSAGCTITTTAWCDRT
jgi:hypothetical protein